MSDINLQGLSIRLNPRPPCPCGKPAILHRTWVQNLTDVTVHEFWCADHDGASLLALVPASEVEP